jgi:glucose-1-phosphate cytidylyltransferase
MVDELARSRAVGSLLLVQPTASFDIVKTSPDGKIAEVAALSGSDIWINGGFFVFRNEIFRHILPGEELVRQPFERLIQRRALLAHKCASFWQCMDTFKDKQRLEELNDSNPPWKVWCDRAAPATYQPAAKVA